MAKQRSIETLRHVLGHDFCWSMPFPSASWSDSISEYQRAELVGRRLVVTSELSRQKELNAELVKSLTGSDRINARRVRERPFTFTPTAKFVLAVNDPPVIEDTSVGMWRRVKLIPFLQSFDAPDTALGDTLRAEAPGILTWAVEGCLEWQKGGLQHPECVENCDGRVSTRERSIPKFHRRLLHHWRALFYRGNGVIRKVFVVVA